MIEWLAPFQNASVSDFLAACSAALIAPSSTKAAGKDSSAAVNESLVADYSSRLHGALGAESQFEAIFAALKADKGVRKQELAEIAKRLIPEAPANLDKKRALGAIQDLHKSARGFDLKLRAMSGRSAA